MSNTYRNFQKFVPTADFKKHVRKVDYKHNAMLVDDGELPCEPHYVVYDENGNAKRDWWSTGCVNPNCKKKIKHINHRNLRINGKNACKAVD